MVHNYGDKNYVEERESAASATDKGVEWLNQVDAQASSNERRSNENCDQKGVSKSAMRKPPSEPVNVEESPQKELNASQLTFEYSESEQLQLSHPPKASKGPQ